MFVWLLAAQKKFSESIAYHKYIRSDEWNEKVTRIKIERGNRCQLCGASGYVSQLDAHHNTYERLGDEKDLDIVILCRGCHEHVHKGKNKPGNIPKIPESHFSVVLKNNGITFTNTDPYRNYARGKAIVQHVVDGFNTERFDYYNRVNINILYSALDNLRGDDELQRA